jgi:hypothetical protein
MEMERTTDPLERLDELDLVAARRIYSWAERRYLDRGIVEFREKDIMQTVARSMADIHTTEDLAGPLELLSLKGWIRFVKGGLHTVGVRRSETVMTVTEQALSGGVAALSFTPPLSPIAPIRAEESGEHATVSDLWGNTAPISPCGFKGLKPLNSPYTREPAQTTPLKGELPPYNAEPEIDPEILEHF